MHYPYPHLLALLHYLLPQALVLDPPLPASPFDLLPLALPFHPQARALPFYPQPQVLTLSLLPRGLPLCLHHLVPPFHLLLHPHVPPLNLKLPSLVVNRQGLHPPQDLMVTLLALTVERHQAQRSHQEVLPPRDWAMPHRAMAAPSLPLHPAHHH